MAKKWKDVLEKNFKTKQFPNATSIRNKNDEYTIQLFELLVAETLNLHDQNIKWNVTQHGHDEGVDLIGHMKCLLLRAGLPSEACKFYSYLSAGEFEADFQNFYTVDLLILDIQLPDVNGTIFAKSFREKFPSSTLVFCSGKQSPTPESFESEPYRYLLKEWSDEHMVEKLTSIVAHIQTEKAEPFIHAGWYSTQLKLPASEIMYIARGRGCSKIYVSKKSPYYTYNDKILCKNSLSDLHALLHDFYFAYAHNSYLVNLQHVTYLNKTELTLSDNSMLTISRSRQKEFQAMFFRYMKSQD